MKRAGEAEDPPRFPRLRHVTSITCRDLVVGATADDRPEPALCLRLRRTDNGAVIFTSRPARCSRHVTWWLGRDADAVTAHATAATRFHAEVVSHSGGAPDKIVAGPFTVDLRQLHETPPQAAAGGPVLLQVCLGARCAPLWHWEGAPATLGPVEAPQTHVTLPSCSADNLLKLLSAQRAAAAAQETVNTVKRCHENQLAQKWALGARRARAEALRERIAASQARTRALQTQIAAATQQTASLQPAAPARRRRLQDASAVLAQHADAAQMRASGQLAPSGLAQLRHRVWLERAARVHELLTIYPVLRNLSSAGEGPLLSIRGLLLPNSEWPFGWDLEKIATALGHVAHLAVLLSAYLDVPLHYPLRLCGSRSSVCDVCCDPVRQATLEAFGGSRRGGTPTSGTVGALKSLGSLGSMLIKSVTTPRDSSAGDELLSVYPLYRPPALEAATDALLQVFRRSGRTVASAAPPSGVGPLEVSLPGPTRAQRLSNRFHERRRAHQTSPTRSVSSFASVTSLASATSSRVSHSEPLQDTQRATPQTTHEEKRPKERLSGRARFDLAVFFLNKDIEQLCDAVDVQVVHLRNSLSNLAACIATILQHGHVAEQVLAEGPGE